MKFTRCEKLVGKGSLWLSTLMIGFMCVASMATFAARTNLVDNPLTASNEGWQMVDLPDGGRFTDAVPPAVLTWTNTPAPLGPSVAITDASSGTIFFSAPPQVVQQLGVIYGSFLQFEMATTHRTWTLSDVVVIRGQVNGQVRAAVGQLPRLPGDDWTPYNLRLVAANFRYTERGGSVIPPREFRELLRSASALWLPAEFGTGPVETTRLRNVRITAEQFLAAQCVPAVTLDGFPGQAFRIEYQETLGNTAWFPLTNIVLTTSPEVFIDTSAIEGLQRYYRAIELP